MSFRRAAGTVARRWLAGGEVPASGAGRHGSGGHERALGGVARFWSFGGSKGDGEDKGEDDDVGDRDAGKASAVSSSGDAGDATESLVAGTSEARGATKADRASPESTSPRWNVPDDFTDPAENATENATENVTNRGLPGTVPKERKKKMSGVTNVTSSVERFDAKREPGADAAASKNADDASSAPRNLYVKNLPRDFNAKKLAHLFMPHGDVQSTKFVLDAGPVPTGLVRFATAREAAAATAALHGATLSEGESIDSIDSSIDSGSESESASESDASAPIRSVRLEISLAMTRAERDAARVARAEERARRKQQRAERAERKKTLASASSRREGEKADRSDRSTTPSGFAVRIAHVPAGLDHRQLRSIFSTFGKLGRVKMMWPNGDTPAAVVTFRDEAAANAAAATLGGQYLPGCKGPMAFEAHAARGARSPRTKAKRTLSEESDSESDTSSSESESESESESSSASSSFALRAESVELTAAVAARAAAARAVAGRVWREVQAARAVSSPEALEKAKALNEAATAKSAKRGGDGEKEGSDAMGGAAEALRRRREARGVFVEPPSARTPPRRAKEPRAPSPRVRAYAERRLEGAPAHRRAVAGPGVDVGEALSEEARAKLAAAAARKRARGRGVGFAGSMAEMRGFGGRGASRGGGGGRGGRAPPDARSARGSRRGRDGDSLDEKTRAALAARGAEAQRASASEVPWEWDVATFEAGARKTFAENLNVAEYASAPWVPGFGDASERTRRAYDDESDFLESRKAFITRYGGIASDAAFDAVKRDAIEAFARYKTMYEKQRVARGESPIEGDFLAERASLADAVADVTRSNPLFDFASRAVDALDGNAGWSYARKTAALRFLANKAARYEETETRAENVASENERP